MAPLATEAIQPVTGTTYGRGNRRDYNAVLVFANFNFNAHDPAGERGTCGVSPRTLRRGESSPDPHQMLQAAIRFH